MGSMSRGFSVLISNLLCSVLCVNYGFYESVLTKPDTNYGFYESGLSGPTRTMGFMSRA